MLRKILVVLMSLSLCWTTVSCGSPTTNRPQQTFNNNVSSAPKSIQDGKYPIQQATYDDATGDYNLMLLNTPPGTPPTLQSRDIQMARLSDEEITNGEKSYLKVESSQPVMYLTEDFRIEYVHNVTETQTSPQTGQQQTVVVRRESNFWTPFAGALAGQAIGNMLFSPRYYVPPIYSSGNILRGYGGYGTSYTQAVDRYQQRYNEQPVAVRNRKTLRTSGRLRSPSASSNKFRRPSSNSSRSTGSGVGSSTLRNSGKSSSYKRSNTGFGSSSSSKMRRMPSSRGFGSRRSGGFRRR